MSLNRVFVALDNMDLTEIDTFLQSSPEKFPLIKIGLELFLKYGPQVVIDLHQKYHCDIFLDLKLHDIPVTVAKAIRSLHGLPIKFLTIHLAGGKEMISSALLAQQEFLPTTKILGVSYLTSLSSEETIDIFGYQLNALHFERLFKLAAQTQIAGVICSPHEVALVKKISPNLLAVTPGVRFLDEINNQSTNDDQKRILDIASAFQNGADYVVMGRSLTSTKNIGQLSERLKIISSI